MQATEISAFDGGCDGQGSRSFDESESRDGKVAILTTNRIFAPLAPARYRAASTVRGWR
jgi:hypothetical protein